MMSDVEPKLPLIFIFAFQLYGHFSRSIRQRETKAIGELAPILCLRA